jgi:cysteinyl-tRNA synthetase
MAKKSNSTALAKEEPEDDGGVKGRALAKKMYKILKKKRAKEKAKKAKGETPAPTKPEVVPSKWTRVLRGGNYPKAVNRPIDSAQIEKMLLERDEAKAAKNYARADEIALEFVDMDLYYVDDKKEYYTRSLKTEEELKDHKKKLEKKRALKDASEPGSRRGRPAERDGKVVKKAKKAKKA